MAEYWLDEDLTTGLDDGSSAVNAFQSIASLAEGVDYGLSEDTLVHYTSDGVYSNQRSILGLDLNGYALTFKGYDSAVLYVSNTYATLFTFSDSYSGSVFLENVTFHAPGNESKCLSVSGTYPVTATNCIFLGDGTGSYGVSASGTGVLNLNNCIAAGWKSYGITCGSGECNASNCYSESDANAYNVSTGTMNLTTCASSDTTGSAGLQSIAYDTSTFTSVTIGSEDFHLVDGSPLIGAGTVTPSYTTDFDGDAWGDPQDIGIYNFTSATTYGVTYNGNSNTSGTAPTDPSSPYDDGSEVTVLGNTGTLVKTGYIWNGWNTASDGSGTHYDAGDTFSIGADTTLYAEWILAVITGTTYDNNLAILPSCTVTLFSYSGGTYTQVDSTTSDGTTGAFSFSVSEGTDYMIKAFLAGTPNVFDCSDSNLNAGDTVDMYLRSQVNKTVPSGDGIYFNPPEYLGN